jgi:hypothetical protein
MSLILQKDRQLDIKLLEYYKTQTPLTISIGELPSDTIIKQDGQKIMELNALINRIKLEYQKND